MNALNRERMIKWLRDPTNESINSVNEWIKCKKNF